MDDFNLNCSELNDFPDLSARELGFLRRGFAVGLLCVVALGLGIALPQHSSTQPDQQRLAEAMVIGRIS